MFCLDRIWLMVRQAVIIGFSGFSSGGSTMSWLREIWVRGIVDVLVRAQVNNNICIHRNSGFGTA